MTLSVNFEMEGLLATLAECERRGLDISKPLRELGREKREDVARTIREAKGFAPHAPGTIAYYERLGRSDKKFGLSGKVRRSYLAKLGREQKRLQGLADWASKNYGGKIPAGLQRKLDAFNTKLRKVDAESRKRRQHAVLQQGQVDAERLLAAGPLVTVKVLAEGSKKRVRIVTDGYNKSANVAFPKHLRKIGATYHVPASAVTQVSAGYYRVQPSKVVRSKQSSNEGGGGGGAVPPILGQVPNTLYYKVVRKGAKFALIWGSRWRTDGRHNSGDAHNPKREHVRLEPGDVNRAMRKLIDYGIAPLRGGGGR